MDWIVDKGFIYATFVEDKSAVLVGRVKPGYITFTDKNLVKFKSKVSNFIKGHQSEIGPNKEIVVQVPFDLSINGLRKVAGGKKVGKWIFHYKPIEKKLVTKNDARAELDFVKKSKAKLDKYIQRLSSSITSLQKTHRGLIKIRNNL